MSAVFLKILNMSITASWLILAVVLVRLLLKKAPKWIPCLLWGLVAIRLVCPFSFGSIFSLIPSSETIPTNITVQQEPAINSGITAVNEFINPVIAESFTPAPTDSVNPLQIIIPIAAIVWIAGIVIMLAYALISYIKLKKTVSVCVPVGERILSCDEVKAPFILGVFRPVIYVPSSMSGETLDLVIRHETAHLQRHDHWWKPLGYLLLAIYWFNPLCWIAYILLSRDIEMACDEKVICDMNKDDIAAYSQALLDCSFPRRRITACPLAFGEVGVKERVKGVLNYKKPAFWIILIAVIACIVLAVCLMTDPFSNKSLSDKLRVSMDMAVAEHNRSSESENRFIATDYDVLLVSKSRNETTVYAWVLYEEYSFDGRDAKLESGSHIPTAITFDTSANDNDSSTYDVIEYWEPRDGSYYADDIRTKFPWSIREKALDITKSKTNSENCLQAAREYFEMFNSKDYSLNDGRYVISESADKISLPYLLISNGKMTIIQDLAVSYQPSGMIERDGNTITMKTVFADETYIWVFELIGHDQVKLHLSDSEVPVNHGKWEDEMVFTLVQEREAEIDVDSLRAKYPEYFDLSTFKGLELYVWQMAEGSYSCGLMLGTNRNKTLEELVNLKGASIAEMKAILSTYDIDENEVFIIPWQNPISSYMPEYWIREKDEDPSSVEKRQQEYIDGIRHMLFDDTQNGGYDLPNSTDGSVDGPGSITIDIRTDVCELYLEVLEDLWNVDPGLNDGISQIGIDLSDLSHLTELEKETVMHEFASKHNLPYIVGTWEELCEQGYIDKDNLYWEDGLFFSIKTNEGGDSGPEHTAFDAQKWRSGLGAYFFGQCTAQKNADGKWSYTVGQEAIS
jgi:Antirepressor regulating drug resistance, predicted signal transduction N-terminal membrane component